MTRLLGWGLLTLGLVLLGRVIGVHGPGLGAPVTSPRTALRLACALRAGILALAVTAVGIAVLEHSATLFWLAVVIAGEETLETSVVIAALHADPGVRAAVEEPPYCGPCG